MSGHVKQRYLKLEMKYLFATKMRICVITVFKREMPIKFIFPGALDVPNLIFLTDLFYNLDYYVAL